MARYLGFDASNAGEYYFISYNSEDEKEVSKYALEMKRAGINMWYDYGIEIGAKWRKTIAERIETSEAIIMFLSKNILNKEDTYVFKEYEIATRFAKRNIYTIFLDEISDRDVPVCYQMLWVDITGLQGVEAFKYDSVEKCVEAFMRLAKIKRNMRDEEYTTLKSAVEMTDTTKLSDDNSDEEKESNPERVDITIGAGAFKRLDCSLGEKLKYETLKIIKSTEENINAEENVKFEMPMSTPFKPDEEVCRDCEKIICEIEHRDSITDEEAVFYKFIRDIEDKKKENRFVQRICCDSSILPFSCFHMQFQPVEYLWIMRMSLLDTPFEDDGEMTTLRKKYANPSEKNEFFTPPTRLACHSGCGVFFVTSDGFIVYQNRFDKKFNRVSFFSGKKSYTVSGSYLADERTVFEFMDDKIEDELGSLEKELYLWELGFEYECLHYQFSFFAFCEETKEKFMQVTNPRSRQAESFDFFDLNDVEKLASMLNAEEWEVSAFSVLIKALMNSSFNRLLKKRNINFDLSAFRRIIRNRVQTEGENV